MGDYLCAYLFAFLELKIAKKWVLWKWGFIF